MVRLSFDQSNPFGRGRAAVVGRRGMVATSQPLASLTGVTLLQEGGNAVDAAVAAAAILSVIEPMSTGPGGDAFAIIYDAKTRKAYGMNSSGRSGQAATLDEYRRRLSSADVQTSSSNESLPGSSLPGLGTSHIPTDSILAATVPGVVAGWEAAANRFGRMPLARLLAPAIEAAEEGFAVAPYASRAWSAGAELLKRDPESARTWFLHDGRTPRVGELFLSPDLALTLRLIAEGGAAAFYKGEIGDRIARFSESNGGILTGSDLADHACDWVEPLSVEYRGNRILEMPPNGQGIAVLEAAKILERSDLAGMGHKSAATIHLQAEAIRLAMSDAKHHVTDPANLRIDITTLISEAYIARQAGRISMKRYPDGTGTVSSADGDTVYVCAADQEGNLVSFINSIYKAWGTGITVPGTGILLQNRASDFSLDPEHVNVIAPSKRTRHTTIPAMSFFRGEPLMTFGFVGGDMQPQAQLQFICNVVDFGMNVQDALDAPRWRYTGEGLRLALEAGIESETRSGLRALGHRLIGDDGLFGAGQAIQFDRERRSLQGGSDARRDGCAIGY